MDLTLQRGSVIVEVGPSGNVEIRLVHGSTPCPRNRGAYVVERADVADLQACLAIVITAQRTDLDDEAIEHFALLNGVAVL